MDNTIISALNSINPAELNYTEWLQIGMALKAEGYDCSVWDNWSKNDNRYHSGECQRKWDGFRGSENPVTAGTIIQMAHERGWTYYGNDGAMDWSDEISDGVEPITKTYTSSLISPMYASPADEIITYIQTIFESGDYVAYVTNDVWQTEDGKYAPGRGCCDRTAAELISGLEKHRDDIGAVMGDPKEEAGAWIRFNPTDGKGVKNDNITKFRYALVESDDMPIDEQYKKYTELQLPIACLVHSGGKSLHAIVHIDAANFDEYKQRVDFLYSYLKENGVAIDSQNRNPSRLSRMPGVTRNGKRQYLAAVNIGKRSWLDWKDYIDDITDDLPEIESLDDYTELPKLPEELIEGVLRCGHKMLISGASKAGKSFLLMELCIAITEGLKWLGFKCRQGKVLYINLEIDKRSCVHRFANIYKAMGISPRNKGDLHIWNLRGKALPLDKLVPKLIRKVKGMEYAAIIIDPIYKVITGDENNASEMGEFCNQFDKICEGTGCSAIYSHHHSKGAQGAKRAIDRASGSGVFARDPDAQLDMIQLTLPDEVVKNPDMTNVTAWRMETSLREFANTPPINFWFRYPIHWVDVKGVLSEAKIEGSRASNLSKSSKRTSEEERKDTLDSAYDMCSINDFVKIPDLAECSGKSEKTIRRYLDEFSNDYSCEHGIVVRKQKK